MAGIIKRSTTNFRLGIPRFDLPNWGAAFERNFDIIDAVLATAGVVSGIVGEWQNNTTYGIGDRVIDTDDNTVWTAVVAYTSAVSGTFAADRAANPSYWDIVNQGAVIRGEFVTGTDYFVGDFVYDITQKLGGVVLNSFIGGANLRTNIADIGVIYDLLNQAIWYDTPQTLTAAEQGQARANIGAGVLGGFRNKIINGDFVVGQRGISFAAAANGYHLDRWAIAYNGAGSVRSVIRNDFSPGASDAPGGCQHYISIDQTTAGTGATYNALYQKIENVRTLAGKKATVTFYAKHEAGNNILPLVYLAQDFGSGGSSAVNTILDTNLAVAGAFTKYSYVVDIPSILGKTVGANNSLRFEISLPINAVSRILFAHVSLVEGDATAEPDPFTPRHIQQELALCQRYFQRLEGGYGGSAVSSSFNAAQIDFIEEMRVAPTIAWVSAISQNNFPSTTPLIGSFISTNTRHVWVAKQANGTGQDSRYHDNYSADAEL